MPRQSRVLTPPADHAFRISWDLSRDTPVNSPTTLSSYLNADNPLIPQEQEITNLCQWSIGLARGIMEVLLHLRPYEQLRRWLVPPLYQRLVTIIDKGSTKLSTRTLPPHSMAYQPNFSNGHRILCDYCARRRQTRHFHASADFQKQMDRHRIGRPVRRAQIKQWRHAPRGACRHRQSHSGRSALLTLLCRATLSTIGPLCC